MMEDRRIRFLIPPILILLSLLFGFVEGNCFVSGTCSATKNTQVYKAIHDIVYSHASLNANGLLSLLALLAGGGVLLLAIGIVNGTLTYLFLRLVAYLPFTTMIRLPLLKKVHSHEIWLTEESLTAIRRKLQIPEEHKSISEDFYTGATFDHDILHQHHPGIHAWMSRRWDSFSIAMTSSIGLLLSLVLGHFWLGIPFNNSWCGSVLALFLSFLLNGLIAYRDTMWMLAFQAKLPLSEKNEKHTLQEPD